jgi:hypothetical protein
MSKPIGRTFYFEKELWALLDADAKRCGRSSVKQLEAILKTYYAVADVELNRQSLEILGEIMPTGRKTIPVLPGGARIEKKKAS